MNTIPIPIGAESAVKDAFYSVRKAIDRLGKEDINFHGNRIINAGDAREGSEYVTLRQIRNISQDAPAVREIRTIVETISLGPWERVGPFIRPVFPGDQVVVGTSGTAGSVIPRLYVMGSNGVVPSIPTYGASEFFVMENNGNCSWAMVTSATGLGNINWYGSGDALVDGRIQYNRNSQAMAFMTAGTVRVRITSAGSVLCAVDGALATTATDGFLYVPTCAGAPTGVPTAQAGMVPLVYDTTNHVLYVRSGGVWRTH